LQKELETERVKYSTKPIAKVKYPPVLKKRRRPTIVMPSARTVSIVLANI
jgi:hypothetical protein